MAPPLVWTGYRGHFALLIVVLAASLAGCAAPPAPVSAQGCDARKVADIPVSFERGFISAAAEIDHKPVTMLIDTGAEASIVTASAKAALALSSDQHNRTRLRGVGGTVESQNARLQSFGVGGMEMMDQTIAVGAVPVLSGPAIHASGLLGADWLSDFDVEFDLPRRRMALYRVHGCPDDYVPWQGKTAMVPIRLYGRGLPLIPVMVDGQRVLAVLDSGAASTTLSQAAADRLNITPEQTKGDRRSRAVGVDGAILEGYRHRFGEIRVGDVRYAGPDITISPIRTNEVADMLLGADWLRQNHVWIDYLDRRLVVEPEQAVKPAG